MLTKNLSITYSMVWSIALANILGAGPVLRCSAPQFAKLATLRYTLILPAVLCIVYIGAFEGLARLGRSLRAAVLRPARLGDEAVQMAAPAAGARLRAGRHHRALPVHLDRALRRRLVARVRSWRSCSSRWPSSVWCARSCRTCASTAACARCCAGFHDAALPVRSQLFTCS